MEQFDLLIRGAAIGVTLIATLRPLFDAKAGRKALSVAVLGICVTCYLVVSVLVLHEPTAPVFPLLILGAYLVPVALTWAVLEIFHERPGRNWAWLALAAVVFAVTLLVKAWPEMSIVRGGLVAFLYTGMIFLAVRSDADDLVEDRRKFRRAFVAAMGLLGVTITAAELLIEPTEVPDWIFPLQASAVLALSSAYGWWTLRPSNPLWPPPTPSAPARLQRTALASRVVAAMENGAWRKEGLTIAALAVELSLTEHRLRAVINGELGHRNFSSFVNGYRIAAAKSALADPARAGVTVLEVAYEVGFASLGPFNRAFRAETGMSPTEFRKSRNS